MSKKAMQEALGLLKHFHIEKQEQAIKTLRRALTEPEKCLWYLEDGDSEEWTTSCNEYFIINDYRTPSECGIKFCCFCGNRTMEPTEEPSQ